MQEAMASVAAVNTSNMLKEYAKSLKKENVNLKKNRDMMKELRNN